MYWKRSCLCNRAVSVWWCVFLIHSKQNRLAVATTTGAAGRRQVQCCCYWLFTSKRCGCWYLLFSLFQSFTPSSLESTDEQRVTKLEKKYVKSLCGVVEHVCWTKFVCKARSWFVSNYIKQQQQGNRPFFLKWGFRRACVLVHQLPVC